MFSKNFKVPFIFHTEADLIKFDIVFIVPSKFLNIF